jgi:hypothetical protein
MGESSVAVMTMFASKMNFGRKSAGAGGNRQTLNAQSAVRF